MKAAFVVVVALLAGCAGSAPAPDAARPGSLSVSMGGSVGTAGAVVSQPRAVLGFDVRIEVDVHLVDHIADGLCVHIATRPIAIDARIAKLSRIV